MLSLLPLHRSSQGWATSYWNVLYVNVYCTLEIYSVSQKMPPLQFSDIFSKQFGIFNQFFTHLLYVPFYIRLQIFIQLSPMLTKLCHTKRDHPAIFYISLELTSMFVFWANYVIFDIMSYLICLLTYKSVYFIVTFHRQRSTKLSTTFVWTHVFWPMVDILSILCELGRHA